MFGLRAVVWDFGFYDTLRANSITRGGVSGDEDFAELYLVHQHWLLAEWN
jgi:hypothetical protein